MIQNHAPKIKKFKFINKFFNTKIFIPNSSCFFVQIFEKQDILHDIYSVMFPVKELEIQKLKFRKFNFAQENRIFFPRKYKLNYEKKTKNFKETFQCLQQNSEF